MESGYSECCFQCRSGFYVGVRNVVVPDEFARFLAVRGCVVVQTSMEILVELMWQNALEPTTASLFHSKVTIGREDDAPHRQCRQPRFSLHPSDRMTLRTESPSSIWRWILITSESLLVTYMVAAAVTGRDVRHASDGFVVLGILASVAWVFLFLGSPFLVSSQRWLAILGWCIAVVALLFSAL